MLGRCGACRCSRVRGPHPPPAAMLALQSQQTRAAGAPASRVKRVAQMLARCVLTVPTPSHYAGPANPEDLFHWQATIMG